MLFPAMVETYAILALLISILAVTAEFRYKTRQVEDKRRAGMTGLEKMKSQILDEAKAAADSKIAGSKGKSGRDCRRRLRQMLRRFRETIAQKSRTEIQ